MEKPLMGRVVLAIRSAGVGVVATGIDLGALALLVSGLDVDVRIASVPALCLGIVAQFVGNKLFAFEDRSKAWARQGAQFLGAEAIGFGANLALFHVLVTHTPLPYLVARITTTSIVYFGVSLPLWGRIFTQQPRGEAS